MWKDMLREFLEACRRDSRLWKLALFPVLFVLGMVWTVGYAIWLACGGQPIK